MEESTALDFLTRLADGISSMFGQRCECVIHDMNNFDKSIIHIAHGHVTGRSTGDKFKVLGTKDVDAFFSGTDLINCKGMTRDNRSLKSSTFHLKGENYHYALGINFDYTHIAIAESILRDLAEVGEDIEEALKDTSKPEERLDRLFADALKAFGRPVPLLRREDKLAIVRILQEHGAFAMQKSVPYLAEKLQVSRYTMYNYLRSINKDS